MADVVQTLADIPQPVAPPSSPELRKARLENALAQIKAGQDFSPIRSWTQGLARLANAGFGGWDLANLEKEDRAARQFQVDMMNRHPAMAAVNAAAGGGGVDRTAAALAGVGPSTVGTAATNASVPTMGSGPPDIVTQMRKNETGGNPYAVNPRSSAAGPDQFINSTWLDLIKKNRPDLMQGRSQADVLALRNNSDISKQMTTAYAQSNQGALTNAGLPATPGSTYLAHFAGPQGAIAIMRADPKAPVASVLGDQVIKANPFLANMTAGDLIGWSNNKMAASGGATAGVAPLTAPAPAPASAPPAPAANGAQPPVPPPAGVAPSFPAQAAPSPPPQTPPISPPQGTPIPGAPRGANIIDPKMALWIRQAANSGDPALQAMAQKELDKYGGPEEWTPVTIGEKAYLVNKKTGEYRAGPDANKPPNAVQEVQYATENWKSLGFPDPASTDPKAQQFWRQLNANRLSGISTMIDQRAPDEFEKEYGGIIAKRAGGVIEAGDKASDQIQKIQLAQNLLSQMQTGKMTPLASTAGGWMQSIGLDPTKFGIDPNLPMTAEAMTAISNEMALGKIGSGGMPANNFSDADRKFLQQTVTSLADRPAANFLKLEAARRVAELQIQKANEWADARANKTSYEEFERDWRKKMQQNNVFGDLIDQAKAFGAQPGQQGGSVNLDQLRTGLEQQFGGAQPAYNAALEEAKRRGWKIPGLIQ